MENLLYEITFSWYSLLSYVYWILIFELGCVLVYKRTSRSKKTIMADGTVVEEIKHEEPSRKCLKNYLLDDKSPFLARVITFSAYDFKAFALVIVVLISVPAFLGWTEAQAQLSVINKLSSGQYETVVGEVADFKPKDNGGRGTESFSVNNVVFEYTEYSGAPGYNQTFYKNGVIKNNGQRLKIDYYMDDDSLPVILRIYEIK